MGRESLKENERVWKRHIKAWEKSGQTQVGYSLEHNLSRHAFFYWKEKFKKHDKPSSMSFVELPVKIPIKQEKHTKKRREKIIRFIINHK